MLWFSYWIVSNCKNEKQVILLLAAEPWHKQSSYTVHERESLNHSVQRCDETVSKSGKYHATRTWWWFCQLRCGRAVTWHGPRGRKCWDLERLLCHRRSCSDHEQQHPLGALWILHWPGRKVCFGLRKTGRHRQFVNQTKRGQVLKEEQRNNINKDLGLEKKTNNDDTPWNVRHFVLPPNTTPQATWQYCHVTFPAMACLPFSLSLENTGWFFCRMLVKKSPLLFLVFGLMQHRSAQKEDLKGKYHGYGMPYFPNTREKNVFNLFFSHVEQRKGHIYVYIYNPTQSVQPTCLAGSLV